MLCNTIVVGAGVIGLSIAKILNQNNVETYILEKEKQYGTVNSSRNSGVIHAGIYYKNHSLKSTLCIEGKNELYKYAKNKKINHKKIGKLIVAQNKAEISVLKDYLRKAKHNNIELHFLDKLELQSLENSINAEAALYSPNTGIIDQHDLMQCLVNDIYSSNGKIIYNTELDSIFVNKKYFEFSIKGSNQKFRCKNIINCGGVDSHQIANRIDAFDKNLIPKIQFIKGNYYKLRGKSPFKKLIYPLPNKLGLGIHSTLNFSNETIFGPDTEKIKNLSFKVTDGLEKKFKKEIFRYWPDIMTKEIFPDYCGVRTTLNSNDFLIQTFKQHKINGLVNLFGINSPGLTSSLAIGNYILKIIDV